MALDPVVLDAELALLTAALQDYLSEDALDVEIAGLLGPHRAELATRATGDPRVAQLVTACADLADESGVAMPSRPLATVAKESAQADYALAAGAGGGARGTEPIASGVSSVHWAAVPHGCFDAADRTVDWTVEVAGHATIAAIRVAATGSVAGIEVRLRSGTLGAFGVLDGDGRATIEILDHDRRPVTEAAAWNHEWPQTVVTVGADVQDSDDAAVLRERLRDVARGRLAAPGPDAYLAEILAAESDY